MIQKKYTKKYLIKVEDSIPNIILKNYKKFENKKIIFDNRKSITYKKFVEKSFLASEFIKKFNLKEGDRVGIYMVKNINQALSIVSCLISKFIFVPILPKLNKESLKHIITNSNMRLIITDDKKINEIKSFKNVTQIINFKEVTKFIQSRRLKRLPENIKINRMSPACIIYSSGSTGRPKGITIPHLNLVKGAIIVSKYLKTKFSDRIAGVLSLNFDYGLNQLWQTLLIGNSLFFHELIFANDFFKFLKKRKITALPLMPVMVYLLFNKNYKNFKKFTKNVRYICSSGGPISKMMLNNLQKTFINSKIYLMYGLTEAFRSTFLNPKLINKKSASVGKAIPTVKIDIIDKYGKNCKPNQPGELVHRGGCISLGYWGDKESSKKVFKKFRGENAVFSGDIFKKDKQGDLYFICRKDHMIKTAGYRVSPTEVEYELMKNKNIINLFVFGVKDQQLGQKIICAYTGKKKISEKKLNQLSYKNLPTYMRPFKYFYYKKFPITGNQGKINKKKVIEEIIQNLK